MAFSESSLPRGRAHAFAVSTVSRFMGQDNSCPASSSFTPSQRHGLTLLELMVVMVILAIVATVAMQSIQPQVDNRRFQSASQLLDQIELAIAGPTQKFQTDGTPLVSGFLSDIGRFPRQTGAGGDSGFRSQALQLQGLQTSEEASVQDDRTLSELWSSESNLAINFPFRFRSGPKQPVDYSGIQLPCGWRGPYLKLSVGQNSLKDPWGRPPAVLADDSAGIFQIQIQLPESSSLPNEFLSKDLTTGKVSVAGKITVPNPEKANVKVALLTPDPDSSLTALAVIDDEDPEVGSFLFSSVPVGLRAVVADVDGVRYVKYVQVPRGGINLVFDCDSSE